MDTNINKILKKIKNINLIEEQPLFVKINGNPYLTTMRTPGLEKEHAIGICLTDGVIKSIQEIHSIKFNKKHKNIIRITIKKSKKENTLQYLKDSHNNFNNIQNSMQEKKKFKNLTITQKEIIEIINPNFTIKIKKITKKLLKLNNHQPIRKLTKATHCATIYDKNLNFLSLAEDIGRHNAVDKAIGECLVKQNICKAKVILLSSRISYELVKKAAKANLVIIAAISRPSSLAIILAKNLNITLASLFPNDNLVIYSHKNRINSNH